MFHPLIVFKNQGEDIRIRSIELKIWFLRSIKAYNIKLDEIKPDLMEAQDSAFAIAWSVASTSGRPCTAET
jgi:hypothetical protein